MDQTCFSLQNKRILVTGASRGIGRALAVGLSEFGANLVLMGRDSNALSETETLIRQSAPHAEVEKIICDIRDLEQLSLQLDQICQTGQIHGLVNNAGMNIRKPALDVTPETWQAVLDTDLSGAFFVAQSVGRAMLRQGGGSIVNISSVGGHVALRTGVAYAAAKAGVIQMTKVLALEWSGQGVRVNGIGPWYFRTPLTEHLLNDENYYSEIIARTPMRRVGELHELIGPTVFLLSEASSYVTGQTLFVDGGMTIYGF
ncbi:SDR family NAD(P)-dependent oxidoreductase [Alicyclobacillus tolerans]|uniref:NAD(P)-dependent dehydrogenase (Short-subunit alcohol dehydrogenase family) n=2 Tax=Alicyclobacillus tolerans TaxID=90970 RepID=A0ABT9LTD5_9BACL|nr:MULTISPECIES: SDR family oxidoreductase [Alicyclobacillus]MDP9727516.1 NAD(P)-dependent dehydrogenase (short-subunit alcohol dehydrogenase family) [Alicyclobacillus tengchongensis]SHJ68612.1 NAD(P)-dependent dehydrogenase, short-chain alcohol dehydrogenase family [Alicyclobacillus montanus]